MAVPSELKFLPAEEHHAHIHGERNIEAPQVAGGRGRQAGVGVQAATPCLMQGLVGPGG